MKNLLLLTLLIIGTVKNGQAKSIYYLFTDTQKEVQDSTVKNNPAMWIIDFEKSIITVQTETEDRIFSFNEYQKVKSIEDNKQFERFILENGGCIYIDNDIQSKEFLQIIYCTEDRQYIFRSENKLVTNKN